jgi:hypothetical protein
MSRVLNIYSSINSFTWRPIDFHLEDDQFYVKKDYVVFDNGLKFNIHEPFKNCADFSFNNRTGMVLTNLIHNNRLFSNKHLPNIKENLEVIESPIGFFYNGSVKILETNYLNNDINSKKVLTNTNSEYFDADSLFYFVFLGGNRVKILNHDKKALTISGNLGNVLTDEGLSFENELFPVNERQVFEYILVGNKISVFQTNTNYGVAIRRKTNATNFKLQNISLSKTENYPDDMVFIFISYKHVDLNFDNCLSDSFLVKYKSDLVQDEEILALDRSFTNNNRYIQNYLALFPVENPIISPDGTASYLLNIHGLK